MSRATLLPKMLVLSMAALCGLSAVSSSALGQQRASAGGMNNFGLGSTSGFGSLGSSASAGGQGAAGMSAIGGTGGLGGIGSLGGTGGIGAQTGGFGGSGVIGSGFDPSFGASQMASGLATAAAVSRVTSQLGGRGGFGGGFGGGGFGGGRGGFGGTNNNQNAQNKTKVRAVLRIGFPIEGRSSSATAQMVTERFAKMPLPPSLDNVQISMQGRTAVLRGQIETVEDGKLVENLLSLEPGIDGVKNELVVAAASEEVPPPIAAE